MTPSTSARRATMRNSTLDLPPTTTTKVGAGDKERAYVVRQNTCLKALLGVICTLACFRRVLLYTRHEVSVLCHAAAIRAKPPRGGARVAHASDAPLGMLLQRHPEDEVHDANVLTTYRHGRCWACG